MGVASVASPAPVAPGVLTLIGLQLFSFGPFDVKTNEAYAVQDPAEPDEGPEPDGAGAAQDVDDSSQEPDNQDYGDDDPESEEADEPVEEGEPDGGAQANPEAPPQKGDKSLILGKFKSPQDLEKGYEEAQKQLGRLHRKVAELERKLQQQESVREQQPKEPPPPPKSPKEIEEENRQRLREFLKDPAGYEAKLIERAREEALRSIQRTQEQRTQFEQTVMAGIQQVAEKYGDFAELEPAINTVLSERPALQRALAALRSDPNATAEDFASLVEDAYWFAKSQAASAALASVREQGRKEAAAALNQRSQANVARQAPRRDQTQESMADRIKREIMAAGRARDIWLS